jgi:type VI protein secretion system component Hcp
MNTKFLFLLLLSVFVGFSGCAFGAGDVYYLTLSGIAGDSAVRGHEKQIVVTGFQYPGLSGSSKSFYIQKDFDSASAPLLMASITGGTITSGSFYCEKAATGGLSGGRPVFTMVFGGLVVDSFYSYDYGTADLIPGEKVSFTFSTLTVTSYPQNVKGSTPVVTPIFYPPMGN